MRGSYESLHAPIVQVPALNLSSVARESPTSSPIRRALQPAETNTNSSALVFKQPKKVIAVCAAAQKFRCMHSTFYCTCHVSWKQADFPFIRDLTLVFWSNSKFTW